MKRLPKKLYKLLELALIDLEKSEQNNDQISIGDWIIFDTKNNKYSVCLAGALMKNTMGLDRFAKFKIGDDDKIYIYPYIYGRSYEKGADSRLIAIHNISYGLITNALFYNYKEKLLNHIKYNEFMNIENKSITPYEENSIEFKNDIKDIIQYLKDKNL